jgi:hypothetical protein
MDEHPNKAGYTVTQCQAGGRARYKTARIHPVYKIFLPNVPLFEDDNLFPSCYRHGQAGGQARIKAATRDNKGRFTK